MNFDVFRAVDHKYVPVVFNFINWLTAKQVKKSDQK
jgi:hypothetical protein